MASGNEIERLTVVLESDYSRLVQQTKEGVDKAEKELDKLADAPKKSQTAWERFGSFLKGPFLGAITAVGAALTGAIIAANKMRDAAIELEKAQFDLAASAGAANREFGDAVGTAESWKQEVEALGDELKIFSNRELSNASARLIDMTKRLGLGAEEMETLLRRTADLSAGKVDLEGGIERVTAALRGEAESAEFLGLTLSETAVKQYAEAHGLLFSEMSDGEKVQARYALLLEQTNQLSGRAAAFAKTQAGAQAELNAQIENSNAAIGKQLLPLYQGWGTLVGWVAGETEEKVGIITVVFANFAAAAVTVGAGLLTLANSFTAVFSVIGTATQAIMRGENPFTAMSMALEEHQGKLLGWFEHIKNIPKTFTETRKQLIDEWSGQGAEDFPAIGTPGGAPGAGGLPEDSGASEAAQEAFQRYSLELQDLQEELAEKLEELEREHAEAEIQIIMKRDKAVLELEQETAKRRLEIEKETGEALTRLADETREARNKAEAKAQDDIATLESETQNTVNQIRAEARETERQETQNHQREMKRLHDDYLLDLEGAVASRDARRIVDLRRQYQKERQEKEQDFRTQQGNAREETEKRVEEAKETERKRKREIEKALKDQLRDLEQTEAEKRKAIETSQEEQMAALTEAETKKRAEIDESFNEQKAREDQHYAEAKAALDGAMAERMAAIAEELAAEEGLESEHAQKVLELLGARYGNEIAALEAFNERKRAILEAQAEWERAQMAQSMATGEGEPGGKRIGMGTTRAGDGAGLPEFATGGIVGGPINKPKLAIVHGGEIIIPPDQSSRFMQQQGQAMAQNLTGNGEMTVTIKHTGSAPPGVGNMEVEQISATLVRALSEAGIKAKRR